MISDSQLNDLYSAIVLHYNTSMDSLETIEGGGELRAARGDSTEHIIDIVCTYLRDHGLNVESRVGKKDLQTITLRGVSKEHQVDRHIYYEGRLVLVIEVKAYLDSCYYERACNDFRVMRLGHPTVGTVVLALENAVADDAVVFTNAVFDDVCGAICYLCKGKRTSSRPMYRKEFRKPIQREAVKALVELVYSFAH